MKFNWKSNLRKSPNSQDEFELMGGKNLEGLNSSGWKISKGKSGNKSPEYHDMVFNNKSKQIVKNNLPPVILKTAQCFYKKGGIQGSNSDEYIKIEKTSK